MSETREPFVIDPSKALKPGQRAEIDPPPARREAPAPQSKPPPPAPTKAKGATKPKKNSLATFAKMIHAFVRHTARDLTAPEQCVWIAMLAHMKDDVVSMSQSHLANLTGLARSTVQASQSKLKKLGLVTTIVQGNQRRGASKFRIKAKLPDCRESPTD